MGGHRGQITILERRVNEDLNNTAKDKLRAFNVKKYLEDLEKQRSAYLELSAELEDPTENDELHLTSMEEAHFDISSKIEELRAHVEMYAWSTQLQKLLSTMDTTDIVKGKALYRTNHPRCMAIFDKLEMALASPGGTNRGYFDDLSKTLLVKMSEAMDVYDPPVVTAATPAAPTAAPSKSSVKTKTLPVPMFDGTMDLYRHWVENMEIYFARMPDVTDQEKAIFLLDAITDQEGLDTIREGQRSKIGYAELMKRLDHVYDKPSAVMSLAAADMVKIEAAEHTGKGIRGFRSALRRHVDTLTLYGDGTIEQLYTILSMNRMDQWMKQKWIEHTVKCPKVPSFVELEDFLLQLATQYDQTEPISTPTRPTSNYSKAQPKSTPQQRNTSQTVKPSPAPTRPTREEERRCPACAGTCSKLYRCDKFKQSTVQQRKEIVQGARICFNCLSPGHNARACTSPLKCRHCGGIHNSLMHDDSISKATCCVAKPSPSSQKKQSTQDETQTTANDEADVNPDKAEVDDTYAIRCTSRVRAMGPRRHEDLLALHDGGSQATIIERKAVHRLGLKPWKVHAELKMMQIPVVCDEAVKLTLGSVHHKDNQELTIRAYVVDDLAQTCPNRDISDAPGMDSFKDLPLSNPNFCQPEHVDILLGVDSERKVFKRRSFSTNHSTLEAHLTIFGYTIGGVVPTDERQPIVTDVVDVSVLTVEDPMASLTRFWQDEEPPPNSKPLLSVGDEDAIRQFEESVQKIDGRYQVALPRKQPEMSLGASRPQAYTRLMRNKQSLQKKGTWDAFQVAVKDYSLKDHAEVVPSKELQHVSYYLPMHGVSKDSTTTKLRVVFDASAKTSNGSSLNDMLWSGPTDYPLLSNLLIRFRRHPIALSADISQMFREILLAPEDRDLHRFLTFDDEGRVVDMRMKRVTFGITSSPFLATRTLRRIAKDNCLQYPEAADIVQEGFYVDDCLTGADTVEDAIYLREQLCMSTHLQGQHDTPEVEVEQH